MRPEPGIHKGVEEQEYRDWDAMAHSDYKAWVEGKRPRGRHFLIGRALHTLVLEPEKFDQQFVRMTGNPNLRYREGKAELKEWEKDGQCALKETEWRIVEAMTISVRSNPLFARVLEPNENTELSVVSDIDGIRCKGRLDHLKTNENVPDAIFDLKGIGCFDETEFLRIISKFGYDSQGAHYRNLYSQETGKNCEFFWLCVSKIPPHETWMTQMTNEMFNSGNRWMNTVFKLYKRFGQPNQPGVA